MPASRSSSKSSRLGFYNRLLVLSNPSSPPTSTSNTTPHIPRPPNSFILYRQAHADEVRQQILKSNPGKGSATTGKVSQVISSMWKAESRAVKKDFEERAKQAAVKHMKKYPSYKYRPAKRIEKKGPEKLKKKKDACNARRRAQAKAKRDKTSASSNSSSTTDCAPSASLTASLNQIWDDDYLINVPLIPSDSAPNSSRTMFDASSSPNYPSCIDLGTFNSQYSGYPSVHSSYFSDFTNITPSSDEGLGSSDWPNIDYGITYPSLPSPSQAAFFSFLPQDSEACDFYASHTPTYDTRIQSAGFDDSLIDPQLFNLHC